MKSRELASNSRMSKQQAQQDELGGLKEEVDPRTVSVATLSSPLLARLSAYGGSDPGRRSTVLGSRRSSRLKLLPPQDLDMWPEVWPMWPMC